MKNNKSRRNFISKIALGVTTMAVPSKILANSNNKEKIKKSIIKQEALGFQWNTADPFLFCVHHEDFYPKGDSSLGPKKEDLIGRNIGQDFVVKDGWRMYHGETIPGFPAHPHRGFETLTIVRKGIVDHADSLGASGRYGGGDVQWLTAGSGVQHSEMFPLVNQDKDNTMELFQIWLNLPSHKKFSTPSYKMFWANDIPKKIIKVKNGKEIEIEVIAGDFEDKIAINPPVNSWAADKNNGLAVWIIKLKAEAEWTLPAGLKDLNRTLYFYDGKSLELDGESISPYHSVTLLSDRDVVLKSGNTEVKLLMLQGRPINEPVVHQYGPFVMNTKEEIKQAFIDYQKDNFGGWKWESAGQTHGDRKRFSDFIEE